MRTPEVLLGQYFDWLYGQVFSARGEGGRTTYSHVCEVMHSIKYRIIIPLDENRVSDGVDLRNKFLNEIIGELLDDNYNSPSEASLLEVLVALAIHAEIMTERPVSYWFMDFINNLNLQEFYDGNFNRSSERDVRWILNRFNNRRYSPNGHGGLFPLSGPCRDQRRVELWYQMGAYMNEKHLY